MNLNSSEFGVIALLLLIMIINAIGLERVPKRVQSGIAIVGRKIIKLRGENPIVSLESYLIPGTNERQNAILDWLRRSEINLRSGE